MINDLPMPIELKKLAIRGYAKHGRGFIRCVSGLQDEHQPIKYHLAEDCEYFRAEANVEHLERLVQAYNPLIEFVLFVDFEYQGKRSHLYPRLVPLLQLR